MRTALLLALLATPLLAEAETYTLFNADDALQIYNALDVAPSGAGNDAIKTVGGLQCSPLMCRFSSSPQGDVEVFQKIQDINVLEENPLQENGGVIVKQAGFLSCQGTLTGDNMVANIACRLETPGRMPNSTVTKPKNKKVRKSKKHL